MVGELGLDYKAIALIHKRPRTTFFHAVDPFWAKALITHIESHKHSGSVYFTDALQGDRFLGCFGGYFAANHPKGFANIKTKKHIIGVEGFWSYAVHIEYNYCVVSKRYFPID